MRHLGRRDRTHELETVQDIAGYLSVSMDSIQLCLPDGRLVAGEIDSMSP
jgi:hypothetical protein